MARIAHTTHTAGSGRPTRPSHARAIAPRIGALLAALLSACASGPPPPDWQAGARNAVDAAVTAHLLGDSRGEEQAIARARNELARTGRPDLMARAELMRCAAHVASLVFEPCEGFERLRTEAAAPEHAYAAHLAAGVLAPAEIALLPPAQRGAAVALAGGAITAASVAAIDDPLSRLIAVAVLFQAGAASPALIALASDTASAQGWRRPLMAWLGVQAQLAERAGDAAEAQRLRRRIELVQTGR